MRRHAGINGEGGIGEVQTGLGFNSKEEKEWGYAALIFLPSQSVLSHQLWSWGKSPNFGFLFCELPADIRLASLTRFPGAKLQRSCGKQRARFGLGLSSSAAPQQSESKSKDSGEKT
ncbi:uncharacterized protein VTP21DRAFT_10864 [Calcarisporiella thermophila]|uniref:uncharacterized protein n=1 Tax=Calcarisporiella thermophila TaxID=911321 RepID=UPI0037440ABA